MVEFRGANGGKVVHLAVWKDNAVEHLTYKFKTPEDAADLILDIEAAGHEFPQALREKYTKNRFVK